MWCLWCLLKELRENACSISPLWERARESVLLLSSTLITFASLSCFQCQMSCTFIINLFTRSVVRISSIMYFTTFVTLVETPKDIDGKDIVVEKIESPEWFFEDRWMYLSFVERECNLVDFLYSSACLACLSADCSRVHERLLEHHAWSTWCIPRGLHLQWKNCAKI